MGRADAQLICFPGASLTIAPADGTSDVFAMVLVLEGHTCFIPILPAQTPCRIQ